MLASFRAPMKRLLVLLFATLALNACEQHKAEDLPQKHSPGHGDKEKHGAVSSSTGALIATAAAR